MTNLGREIASAVHADWSELREEVAWSGVRPRQRRRVVARIGLACALATAAVGIVKLVPRADQAERMVAPPVAATEPVQVPQASETAREPLPERITIDLPRGKRRFEFIDQMHEIRSGHVTIEAHNAVFACARSAHSTSVEVFRGSVLVRNGDIERELAAGEQADFAEPGTPRLPSTDPVEDLLRTADVMRMSKQPAAAIEPLRRVVKHHAADPRAPLAAFTLGRVLLDELDRPGEAAAAFADALRLAPHGPLVEDAIARRVEALSRAGDASGAHLLAEGYVQRFPHGRKQRAVRTFGGLR